MFHLYQPEHIEWPVSVDLPAKGGTKKTYKFTGHFHVLDQEDSQELQDQHNRMLVCYRRRLQALQGYVADADAEEAITAELPCTYQDLADAVLCGWGDEVVDEAGEPVEYSEAAKARLFRIQGAAAAVFNAWLDSLGSPTEKGAAKAGGFRAKNS
jgi:hypothetical protein